VGQTREVLDEEYHGDPSVDVRNGHVVKYLGALQDTISVCTLSVEHCH
jgi:hypothetical protein